MHKNNRLIYVSSGALLLLAACTSVNVVDGGGASGAGMLDRSVPAEGWRWESSLGVEVAVPDDWKINDTDCNQTDAPSVVRGQGAANDCLTPEPTSKQIVEIMLDTAADGGGRPQGLSFDDVTIDAEPAERGEGETQDGRAAGWLHIPGIGVIVDVRVKDDTTLQMVLDSVRVVDVDHNQCATSLHDMHPSAPKATTLVPTHTSGISVCYYGSENVLQASTLIEDGEAQKLVDALNGAKAGRNADVPETQCLREAESPPPDVMLIVHGDDDSAQLEVTFSGCTHRGLSNGRSDAQLTQKLLQSIMSPLKSGYGFSSLPD